MDATMEKKERIYRWGGFLFTCVAGTLLHFVYEWSGNLAAVAWFAPVNESVWEHLKLLFFPALLWDCGAWFALDRPAGFWAAAVEGILAGLWIIVSLFYTYVGILGFSCLPADLGIFILSAYCCFTISYRRLQMGKKRSEGATLALMATLLLLFACFVIFSYCPPDIALFVSP